MANMRTINQTYDTEVAWREVLAKAMGGVIDGNFIRGDNEFYKGTHFLLKLEDRISAMLIDVTYKEDVLLEYRKGVDSYVGLYFYIMDNDVSFVHNNESTLLGKDDYNLSVVDSSLDLDYTVNKGTRTFVVCIFMDKIALKDFMEKVPSLRIISKDVFNPKKNTIISMDRMSAVNSILIKNFMNTSYDGSMFEFCFRGLVYKLLSNYLEQLLTKKFIMSKVMRDDVKNIIASKALLMEYIDEVFPGVNFLAEKAFMSPSKYKKLFTKISGVSPGAFFYANKLERAKKLLETGQYTVGEVSEKLNYANISYLAKRFNRKYGIFPKEYQDLL